MGEEIEPINPREVEIWRVGKPPISFLKCKTCYIARKCPLYDVDSIICAIEDMGQELDATTPEGIIGFIQTMISLQARRVVRLAAFEDLEGGIPDPRVSEEILTFMDLVNKLKNLVSEEDSLVLRVKGKATSGVLAKLFGDE
jgi:hypothetical protein